MGMVTPEPTNEPTPEPTPAPVPTEPTKEPTPKFSKVCGSGYTDAANNFCTNPTCDNGECETGTCYALPYAKCEVIAETIPAEANAVVEESLDVRLPTSPPPTQSPSSATPSYNPTEHPTQSPVYNVYFCGETYLLAEENCWTAELCSLTNPACSKPGEDCYGISLPRCLSPAPTDAPTGPGPRPSASPTVSPAPTPKPTLSMSPTKSPTPSPSKSPVVNVLFCGETYNEAVENCSEATACPSGVGCPGTMQCYNGIMCPATMASSEPNLTTDQMTTPADGSSTTLESDPTVLTPANGAALGGTPTKSPANWLQMLGLTAAPTPNMRFCGFNRQDAADRCATTIPCPNGISQGVCPDGQTCFPIQAVCAGIPLGGTGDDEAFLSLQGSVGGATGSDDGTIVSDVITMPPTPAPSSFLPPSPTDPPVHRFDPSVTSFCGDDYNDALENCYANKGCPTNSNAECPSGQTCYPGITGCTTPPPTMSQMPTNPDPQHNYAAGGAPSSVAASMSSNDPIDPETAKPTWNMDYHVKDNAGGLRVMCWIAKSVVLGGVILGASGW